jgi:hypothetical protein
VVYSHSSSATRLMTQSQSEQEQPSFETQPANATAPKFKTQRLCHLERNSKTEANFASILHMVLDVPVKIERRDATDITRKVNISGLAAATQINQFARNVLAEFA